MRNFYSNMNTLKIYFGKYLQLHIAFIVLHFRIYNIAKEKQILGTFFKEALQYTYNQGKKST